jgi:hypothetical protein
MTNGTDTDIGQMDCCVGGVSKAYRSKVVPPSFVGRSREDNLSIG